MITFLTIRNFQPHKKRKIKLDPRITTFVGPTDAGKSAIIRALKWICTNSPSGAEFISHGATYTHAKLKVDGHTITRTKGRGSGGANTYVLDGDELKAFKQNVPDAVAKVLNISEDTFQEQHDAPFWFSLSAGQVSKELNQIVDLGNIDEALSNIASDLRRSKTEVDVINSRLTTARGEKKELKYVLELNADLERLEQLDKKLRETRQERRTVAALLKDAAELEDRVASIGRAADVLLPLARKLDASLDELEKVSRGREEVSEVLRKYAKQKERTCLLANKLEAAERKLHKLTKGKCPVCGMVLSQS